MKNLIKKVDKKVNSIIWSFYGTGIVLIMLAILIAWDVFILKLIVSLFVLLTAYAFIFAGYRIHSVKKEIEKYFSIK